MALRREDDQSFGDNQHDIREELIRYSKLNGYVAEHFADAKCECGATELELIIDDNAGVAARLCPSCDGEHGIGDSDEYVNDDTDPWMCECLCDSQVFEVTVGVALSEGSEDVRWIYIGCRCPQCGLTGCYGDWKNEFSGYQKLLANV
jgi:hypothetical protein